MLVHAMRCLQFVTTAPGTPKFRDEIGDPVADTGGEPDRAALQGEAHGQGRPAYPRAGGERRDAKAPERAVENENQPEQQERNGLVRRIRRHELRQEGEKEQRHFRVQDVGQRALREHLTQRNRAARGYRIIRARLRARQQHFHPHEAEIGRANPFTNVNAADDAASSADSPIAAANT